ncbi:MAG: ABC transporter substrate-binding protein [Steroidobacteraceae bacterium]
MAASKTARPRRAPGRARPVLAILGAAALLGPLGSLALAAAASDTAAPAASVPGDLGSAVDASSPAALIQSAAGAMLKDLDAHRADYRKDPQKVQHLVDQVLLPHFDTEYAARLVLGRHWNSATADQRTRFVAAFYKSLLSNYGDALVDFTADRLRVFPYNGDPKADFATVRTEVRKSDGSQEAVNYSLRHSEQGWKAWDVVIEGISYVKSFRDDFGAQIEQQGIDAVITRLESGEKPSAIKGAAGKG